jgi:hypothetical protein
MIKFEDRGNYIYFEYIEDDDSSYIEDIEFTYKFVRYKCRTNIYKQYYYDKYEYLISLVIDYLGEGIKNKDIYYGNRFYGIDNIENCIVEIIAKKGLYYYYIYHDIDSLDVINIENNIRRYCIDEYGYEIYCYSLNKLTCNLPIIDYKVKKVDIKDNKIIINNISELMDYYYG